MTTPVAQKVMDVQRGLIKKSLEDALYHMAHLKNIRANANEPYSDITAAEGKVKEAGFWAGVKCSL